MSGQAAAWILRRSARRMAAAEREERLREWSAEIAAIRTDAGTRPAIRRARAAGYALGVAWCCGDPLLAGSQGAQPRRQTARRVAAGLGMYLAAGAGLLACHAAAPHSPWPLIATLAGCACLDLACLADLARPGQSRYLPKWGWALACVTQSPFGALMYLSAGRSQR